MRKATLEGSPGRGNRLTWSLGVTLLASVACQAVLGLDDYKIEAPQGGGSGGSVDSTGPGGGAGTGGSTAGTYSGGAGTAGEDSGAGGCGEAPDAACLPTPVAVSGVVRIYDTQVPLAGARLETGDVVATTDMVGAFAFEGPPESTLPLVVQSPDTSLLLPFRRTVLAFDSGVGPRRLLVDVPAVSHAWLEQVARDCGVIPVGASEEVVRSYFNGRNTILVEVIGSNAVGITPEQIDVGVDFGGEDYSQFHNTDPDTTNPTRICFLESGDAGNQLRGGTGTQTNALGRFVVFRVRNRNGLGTGRAVVRIVQFADSNAVELPNAGLTAVVRIGGDW